MIAPSPTPDAALTEEERAEIAHTIWFGAENGPIAAEGELAAAVERLLAARTAALTERLAEVEAERDDACRGEEAWVAHHDREHRWHMEALARAEAAEARETALREAVEALADEYAALATPDRGWDSDWDRGYASAVRFVKQRLGRMTAEHEQGEEGGR